MKIGVIGLGRLGKVIVDKLSINNRLMVCDAIKSRENVFIRNTNVIISDAKAILSQCEISLLIVDPKNVVPVISANKDFIKARSTIVNMATSVSSISIRDALAIKNVNIMGLKMIGQYTALEIGNEMIFVTESNNNEQLGIIKELFQSIGKIVIGDENIVGAINRIATSYGLHLYYELTRRLKKYELNDEMINSAIQNVAVGTIKDMPLKAKNDYIEAILRDVDDDPQRLILEKEHG